MEKKKKKILGPEILTHVTEGLLIANRRGGFGETAAAGGRGWNPVSVFVQI